MSGQEYIARPITRPHKTLRAPRPRRSSNTLIKALEYPRLEDEASVFLSNDIMTNSIHETAANAIRARKRIRHHIYETPLLPARKVGQDHGSTVLFKAENFQLTGSFKLRGAMSKMSANTTGDNLITASSGNHGVGAALASRKLGKSQTVVLPETVVQAKLEKIKFYGVDVILHGDETGLAEQHAQQLAASGNYTYLSPYNDPDIIAGQGTIGLEILEQCDKVDNVFISMGGGGLISGIASVIKAFSPETVVYGVSAINSKALAASIAAGKVVETEHLPTLAEAVAGGIDDDTITLPLATATVDHLIDCSEEEILDSLRTLAVDENMIVEGSAALALAGYKKAAKHVAGQTSIIVLCGANVDPVSIRDMIFGS